MAKMYVSDLMSERLHTLRPDDTLQTARELMFEHRIRHLPVIDEEDHELVGLVTHRDLLRHTPEGGPQSPGNPLGGDLLAQIPVETVMTRELETATADLELGEAARTMIDGNYGCLPVVEGKRLVGIITESDFVRLVGKLAEQWSPRQGIHRSGS